MSSGPVPLVFYPVPMLPLLPGAVASLGKDVSVESIIASTPSPLASAHLSAADRVAIFCTELRTCVGGWVELRLERSALRRVWVLPPGLFSVVTQGRNSSGIPRVDTVPGASLGPQHLGQGSPFTLR